MKTIIGCALIGWFLLGAISTILFVGRPRKPISPGMAAGVVVLILLEIVALLYGWDWYG